MDTETMKEGPASPSPSSTSRVLRPVPYAPLLIALGLVLLTLAVFWPVGGHEFLNYDDPDFVTLNDHVQEGLTANGIFWAITHTHSSDWEWHPITWLSHMLDVSLFGMNPAGHHWMNLIFHIANVLLLFIVLRKMTGALWPSALVAALFAIHPLHVESVAWVSERKDVLSTFFGFLTLWAYVGYVKKKARVEAEVKAVKVSNLRSQALPSTSTSTLASTWLSSYFAVLFFFTLSLMAKPMLVTLPFLLLLLDYWPLGRLRLRLGFWKSQSSNSASTLPSLLWEKFPLFLLVIVSTSLAFWGHQKGEAIRPLYVPFSDRISNALVSYVSYLGKTLWPQNMAVVYPHPGNSLPLWQIFGSAFLLLGISIWVLRQAERRPYLFVGWLWYLGTLVPVIQIVQLGSHAMADRYTYIPLIGIFIMIGWGATEFGMRNEERGMSYALRTRQLVLAGVAGILLVLLSIVARVQVGYWKDSISLFRHAVRVTENNYIAHNNLGSALIEQGRPEEAVGNFEEAIRIKPDYYLGHYSLGVALSRTGRHDEAVAQIREAVRITPDFALAHFALAKMGKPEEATQHYSEALRIDPDFEAAHNDLGLVLAAEGKIDEAARQFRETVRINPNHAEAHYNLGTLLTRQGLLQESVNQYSEAIRIRPDYFEAYTNLGALMAQQGRFNEAATDYAKALLIRPDHEMAYHIHYNLGLALEGAGKLSEAKKEYSEALRLKPDFAEARAKLEEVRRKR